MEDAGERVTRLLEQIGRGEALAAEELLPLVYGELRHLARARLAREKHRTSQPTSLVHEAYLRLVGDRELRWENRAHFFAAAGEAMRRILIERARRRGRLRHGGGRHRTTLDERKLEGQEPPSEELLALDQALSRLEQLDRAMGDVVKLRYFAGLTIPETAEALHLSPRTVNRLWTSARAWLHRELAAGDPGADDRTP